jgi:hypothetical protein
MVHPERTDIMKNFVTAVRIGVVAVMLLAARSAAAQWQPMWGNLAAWAPPAAASRMVSGVEVVSVYGVDANSTSNVWVNEINTSTNTPSGWNTNLGGFATSAPTAVGWTNYRDVFVLSSDWQLYHNNSTDNVHWSGWQKMQAPSHANGLCSNPHAISWSPGRIDVLVTGCDNHLYMLTYAGSWNWADRGCCYTGDPSVASAGPGDLNISIMQTNGTLAFLYYQLGVWNYAFPWSGVSSPAAGYDLLRDDKTYAPAAFMLDSNGSLFGTDNSEVRWSVSDSGMHPITALSVATDAGSNEVYFLDSTNRVMRRQYDHGWFDSSIGLWNSGVTFVSQPSVITLAGTPDLRDIYVFAIKSDGSLWFARDPSR